jgi:hypothetical protein
MKLDLLSGYQTSDNRLENGQEFIIIQSDSIGWFVVMTSLAFSNTKWKPLQKEQGVSQSPHRYNTRDSRDRRQMRLRLKHNDSHIRRVCLIRK